MKGLRKGRPLKPKIIRLIFLRNTLRETSFRGSHYVNPLLYLRVHFSQIPLPMKSVKVPALEMFLHEMIPLAKAMGVSVEVSDEQKLVLSAPLEPNKNSINTAFGGSLVSLATLAGYGVVWELMRDPGSKQALEWRIVVKESKAAYRRPVLGDLRAICERPAKAAIDEFRAALQRYGQAKLKLHTRIVEGGNTAVDFQAAFVVVAKL